MSRGVALASGFGAQTLSFYDATGHQHGRDKLLSHDPCCVSHFGNGEYLCVGGSDRKATLWTKDGVRLTTIAWLPPLVASQAARAGSAAEWKKAAVERAERLVRLQKLFKAKQVACHCTCHAVQWHTLGA